MLGRDSIKDHTTALVELVKNSYDADATNVEVEIFCSCGQPYIRISDNGDGMTGEDLDKYWLRIGYSMKRKSKYSSRRCRRTAGLENYRWQSHCHGLFDLPIAA